MSSNEIIIKPSDKNYDPNIQVLTQFGVDYDGEGNTREISRSIGITNLSLAPAPAGIPIGKDTIIIESISYEEVTNNKERYNSNNHHDFFLKDIDNPDWWECLSVFVKTELEKYRGMDDFHRYLELFAFENWNKGLVDAELVEVREPVRKDLEAIATVRLLTSLSTQEYISHPIFKDFISFNIDFIREIQKILNKFGKVFIKTSEKSAKNDSGIYPVSNVEDVINQITSSNDVFRQSITHQNRCKYLVFQRWNDEINEQNEFRVIIEKGRILGISQQKWWKAVGLTEELCLVAAKAILHWWKTRKRTIHFNSVVLDMWVDFKEERAHLIECNPGFKWGSSGSALFHWILDDVLLQSEKIWFRYVA